MPLFFHDIKDRGGRERYSLISGIRGCAAQRRLIFRVRALELQDPGVGHTLISGIQGYAAQHGLIFRLQALNQGIVFGLGL